MEKTIPEMTVKMTLEITDNPRAFCLLFTVIWMKDDRTRGRTERERISKWVILGEA